VTAALEAGRQPDPNDLPSVRRREHARPDREHVGVVVRSRQTRHVEVVAERRADPDDLVRGDLLPLTGSTEDDRALRLSGDDRAGGRDDERRVVDGIGRIGPHVEDLMPLVAEEDLQVLLERVSGMVGAERDPHVVPLVRASASRAVNP
jgi:hypothetical protein